MTEHELIRTLQILDAIEDKMGVIDQRECEFADHDTETKPVAGLTEIDLLQQSERP